ncbi:MAG: MBL fold metallo-hydrolase, partial [Betaproteobacteria bacterium]
ANALKAATGAVTAVGMACESVGHDRALQDGDILPLGGAAIHVIATPGHTPGSVTYKWSNNVFTGDALLIEGCGRTDFQDGSSEALYASITGKLFSLPDETVVWPAHDYHFRGSTTIGHEKRHNPRLAGKDCAAFCKLMANLKLAPPKLIEQAVPANRSGGALQSGENVLSVLKASDLVREFDVAQDVLVDLRDDNHVRTDPLENSIRVGHQDIEHLNSLARDHRKLFLICHMGRRSLLAADALFKAGADNVWSVTGGMLALRDGGQASLEAQTHD